MESIGKKIPDSYFWAFKIIQNLRYMLDREYAFFCSNKDSLFSEYPNQYVIIIGEKVIKAFGTLDEAYAYAASKYEPGTFFIEQCTGSIPQQIFHSRVVFA